MKTSNDHSLRTQVDKWLAPHASIAVHVTQFSRTRWGRRRYVCVETSLAFGSRALFFFRHDDGCWCVFPPADDKQATRPARLCA
jgi:hypothetical protein